MTLMRAICHAAAGGPEVLLLRSVPRPDPGPEQIRVAVHAAGLNRADLLQRRGGYPAPPGWPADIPGLEYAGAVEAVGPGVTRWQRGDRVMGLVGGGAHAEAVVVHQAEALPVPPGLSDLEAAALPEAFLTAFDALTARGRLRAGERVLLHAVASGVGTAAVQLARRCGAAAVLGTSRTADKLARVRPLGLDMAIDTRQRHWPDAVTPPVDVILDVLGGPALADNLAVLAPRGRLVLLGFLAGARAEVDLGPLLRHRLEVVGTVMRTRSLAERIPLVQAFAEQVLPGFAPAPPVDPAERRPGMWPLHPVVGAVYPLAEVAEAHRAMEQNATFGKVVLEVRGKT